MAVDTAQKRFSLVGFGSPIPAMLFPPSGDVEAIDRADALYLYSGIELTESQPDPVAEATNTGGWVRGRRKPRPMVTLAERSPEERRRLLEDPEEPAEAPAEVKARPTLTAESKRLTRAQTKRLIGALERLQNAETDLETTVEEQTKARRRRITITLLLLASMY